MLGRAHTATGATNIAEVNKLFLTHHALEMSYPDGLDNLVNDSDDQVFDSLPGATRLFSPLALDDQTAPALYAAGITEVYNLADSDTNPLPADWDPTFNPYADATPEPVDDSLTVVQVATADVAEVLDTEAGSAVYVVFGLGRASPITGGSGMMLEAPVHFGEQGEATPDKVYSRFGVVFQLRDFEGDLLSPAQFTGAVAFHNTGIVGAGHAVKEFHEGHKH
jgi:hypothetical protein